MACNSRRKWTPQLNRAVQGATRATVQAAGQDLAHSRSSWRSAAVAIQAANQGAIRPSGLRA
eukprot:12524982-Alexandrium_andersonii.AAC.1